MPPNSSNDNPLVIGDTISPIDDDDEFGLRQQLSKPARRLRRQMQTQTLQKTIKNQYNSDYNNKLQLYLEELKNSQKQNVKVDLTKTNIRPLATQIGVLSEGVKLCMKLLTAQGYHALNDGTNNLVLKGDINMSTTTSEAAEVITDSDKEIVDLIKVGQEVECFTVAKHRTRAGGPFFSYRNIAIFDFIHMSFFYKEVDIHNYKHNCVHHASQSRGLPYIKLQVNIIVNKSSCS